MLLKSADSKESWIASLESQLKVATGDRRSKLERDLRNLRAGIKAENEAAYLINFDYEKSQNWVIIHDLRLEVGGRVAQIDHVLINRFLDVFVLETKSFHSGLKINDEGEFLRWNDFAKRYEGMESPLAQNERHLAVLKDAFQEIKMPSKLGVTITPTYYSLVLVSANARIDRPKSFDASKVIKADALKPAIGKQFDNMGVLGAFGSLAKMVDEGTLYAVGRRLAGMHRPLHPSNEAKEEGALVGASVAMAPPQATPSPVSTDSQQAPKSPVNNSPLRGSGPLSQAATADPSRPPACKACGKSVGNILYGQYGYYFKCTECSANTSMKWDCGNSGHSSRIRKDGPNFYRDCEGCGVSHHFHSNAAV